MRGKEIPVVGGAAQELGILEELSEASVAVIAEEAAHHAGVMGVIDARRAGELLPADEAEAVLALDHPLEILLRQPVFPSNPVVFSAILFGAGKPVCAIFGVGRIAVSLLHADPFAIGLIPSPLVGEPPFAPCGILCVSVVGRIGQVHSPYCGWRRAAARAKDAGRRAAGGENVRQAVDDERSGAPEIGHEGVRVG